MAILIMGHTEGTGAPVGPDIDGATYDGTPYVLGGSSTGLNFKPDGTSMYMINAANEWTYQWNLSPAWDVTTASLGPVKNTSGQDGGQFGLAFSPTGHKMYTSGRSNDRYYQYTVNTPWEVNTAFYDFHFLDPSSSFNPSGFQVSADGTLIVGVVTGNSLGEFTMGAWDIDSAGVNFTNTHNVSAQDTNIIDVKFNGDGTKMFVLGSITGKIYRYTLGTPYSLASVTYDNHFVDVSAVTGTAVTFAFSVDYSKMYVVSNSSPAVYPFTL